MLRRALSTALGPRGERHAARWLRRRGYRILARNLRRGRAEADLLALAPDGETIVLIEVKTRATVGVRPEERVDSRKQYRMAELATRLSHDQRFAGRPLRLDVVSVVWPKGRRPCVRHYPGAFDSPL